MSIAAYEEMLEIVPTDSAINEAERELSVEGELLDARMALASLRRKDFG